SVSAGGSVALQFVIINQGTVATSTPTWTDKVFLSLDNKISSDDTVIASLGNGSALAPGESYQTIVPGAVIPKRYRGDVFLIVQADADNAVAEFPNEDNNTLAIPLTVKPLPPSDLVTSTVVAPEQVFDSSTIE